MIARELRAQLREIRHAQQAQQAAGAAAHARLPSRGAPSVKSASSLSAAVSGMLDF